MEHNTPPPNTEMSLEEMQALLAILQTELSYLDAGESYQVNTKHMDTLYDIASHLPAGIPDDLHAAATSYIAAVDTIRQSAEPPLRPRVWTT